MTLNENMNVNATSELTGTLMKSRLLSAAAALASLAAGILTASAPLLILSGVFAYGWPLLHLFLAQRGARTTAETAYPASPMPLQAGAAR